jgi:poly-gamma-glutamate capsule biosynthesis protein CapA/YwtB (metallophosphatase superfamily)
MRSAIISSVLVLGVLSITACPVETLSFPVERQTGRVSGRVQDEAGAPVAGVRVQVGERATISGADGSFVLDGVSEGGALGSFSVDGYGPRVVSLSVVRQRNTVLDVVLSRDAPAQVVFSGDVMFGRRYLDPRGDGSHEGALTDAHDPRSFERIVRHVAPLVRDADLFIPNVETAFAWRGVAHPSKPFVFLSPPTSVAALRFLGADVAGLANNHTYDFFEDGLRSTLDELHAAGIQTVGAGLDEDTAYAPLVVTSKGVRLGIAAFCGLRICGVRTGVDTLPDEPPYQDARGELGGVAKLSDEKLLTAIDGLKKESDRVTVLLHSGNEYSATPTAGQQNAAHDAIDLGADLVIGHHPHVVQAFEAYKGKLIAYSLGNLVFDQDFRETWAGAVLRVEMTAGPAPLRSFAFDPIMLEDYVPYPTTGRVARSIIRYLGEISAPYGVTVVEEQGRGRILLSSATSLKSVERYGTRAPIPEIVGGGATVNLEDLLGPGTYLSSVEGDGVSLGRDVLYVGSFENELVGSPYEHADGWNVVSEAQHIVTQDARDGTRALQICRDITAPATSGLYSAGRHEIPPGRTYSLCGCLRGSDMAEARASIVYWDTIATDAQPIASHRIVTRKAGSDWGCFCGSSTPPPRAVYVNVRLEANDEARATACNGVDRGLHCVDWDALRLVEWQRKDGAAIALPNHIDFLRVDAPTSAISFSIRTLQPGGAGP